MQRAVRYDDALARTLHLTAASLLCLTLAACDSPPRGDDLPGTPAVTLAPLEPEPGGSPEDPGDLLRRTLEVRGRFAELRITPDMPVASRHLAGGWSAAERWQGEHAATSWRWSLGPTSRIRFQLEEVEPLTATLRALPFQPPGGRRQHVELWVNELYLRSLALAPGDQTYEIALPAPALRAGQNVLRFVYAWTEQPANVLPDNPDRRDLAMALAELRIRPQRDAPPNEAPLVAVRTPDREAPLRGLLAPRQGYVSVLVWPPPGSSLELGWVRLRGGGEAPRGFRVEVEWDQGRHTLLEGRAARADVVDRAQVPLPPEALGALRLRFQVDASEDDPSWVWVEPRIVPPAAHGEPVNALPPPLRAEPGTNVVLLLLDAASRDRFGVYGAENGATPRIDALAAESIVFEAAYAQASYTLTAMASLFTSRLPSEHGVLDERDRLGPQWPTLAEVLRDAGYGTAAFSGNPYVSSVIHMTRGFQRVDELFRERPSGTVALGSEFVAPVRSWIEEQGDRPFFTHIHLIQPHEPYNVAPERFYDGRLQEGYTGRFDGSQAQMREVFRGAEHPGLDEADHIRALYEGNLAYADSVVGEIVSILAELGLAERTVVVVTADHGESLGERGIWGHGNSVEREQIALPLIVHLPGALARAERDPRLVAAIDLMPSLLDLLGVPAPPGLRGQSWFAPAAGGAEGWPRSIVSVAEGRSGTVSLLVPGFKYSHEQANGRERLLPLPEEEDGENLRWDHPVTFAYLASEAARLLSAQAASGPAEAAEEFPEDVKEALRALGYVE